MSYLNLDLEGSELDTGFCYCANCDTCSDFKPVAVNELYERWQCQNCGALGRKLCISDYGYMLQCYLLSGSEFDEGLIPLYDGGWK